MKKLAILFISTVVLFLTGCAAYKPVPEGYAGPVAMVRDSTEIEDGTKARMFFIEQVDGNRIDNSRSATKQSNYGRGFSLATQIVERAVPIETMKVKLVGTHVVGAPIHEFASRMAGTFFDVEGVVEFTPKPNGKYIVKGVLKKGASSIWVEDEANNEPATIKIVSK